MLIGAIWRAAVMAMVSSNLPAEGNHEGGPLSPC